MYNQTFCCPLHYKNGLFIPLGLLAILYQVTTTVPHFVSMCFLSCRLGHPVRGYSSSWSSVTSPFSDLVSRNSPSHLSNVLSLPISWVLSPEARTGFVLLVVQHPTSRYPTQVCIMGPGCQHPVTSSWTFVPVIPPQPYLFGTRLVFKCWWVPGMGTCLDLCEPKATTEALLLLVTVGSQPHQNLSSYKCPFEPMKLLFLSECT